MIRQRKYALAAAASVTVTMDSTPKPNSILVAMIHSNVVTAGAISGFTDITSESQGVTTLVSQGRFCDGTESNTFTANAALATVMRLWVVEITNSGAANLAGAIDSSNDSNSGGTTGQSYQIPQLNTGTPSCVLLTGISWNAGTSANSQAINQSYTVQQQDSRMSVADRLVTATGAFDPTWTWTTNRDSRACHVAIKQVYPSMAAMVT